MEEEEVGEELEELLEEEQGVAKDQHRGTSVAELGWAHKQS